MTDPAYLSLIDDATRGNRSDVTPLFGNYVAFSALIKDLTDRFDGKTIEVIAGIDALGFILGSAIAMRLRIGFLPIRKGGKLPVDADRIDFVDYSGQPKALEIRVGAIRSGARVLVVDEWIETGAQVQAAIALIEGQGGTIVGIAAIHMDVNATSRPLTERYNCQAIETHRSPVREPL